MASLGKLVSTVAGVVAMNGLSALLQSQASGAAWGWTMSPPAGAGFSCSQGATAGCSAPGCTDFACTVVPDAGMMCDVSSINVMCEVNGSAPAVPSAVLCVNIGSADHTVDSELVWSHVPTCSMDPNATTTVAPMTTTTGPAVSDVSDASRMAMPCIGMAALAAVALA